MFQSNRHEVGNASREQTICSENSLGKTEPYTDETAIKTEEQEAKPERSVGAPEDRDLMEKILSNPETLALLKMLAKITYFRTPAKTGG